MNKKFTTPVACAVGVVAMSVAGCSSNPGGGSSASTSSSSSTSSIQPGAQGGGSASTSSEPTSKPSAPTTASDVSAEEVGKSAVDFIDARENATSAYQKDDMAWVEQAKPYVTDRMYKELGGGTPGSVSIPLQMARDAGVKIKVDSKCSIYPEGEIADKSYKVLTCDINDTIVGKDGKVLPPTKVPAGVIGGVRPSVMLQMKDVGGSWKVDKDLTGQGG